MSTEDRDRYYRVATLIVDGGGMVARSLLLQKVRSAGYTDIHDFLQQKKTQILNNRYLGQIQLDLMFPPSGAKADVGTWDITLISCLLSRYTPLTTLETTLLESLRDHRNYVYGHAASASLGETDFRRNWSLICSDVTQISHLVTDVQFQSEVRDFVRNLETRPLSAGPVVDVLKSLVLMDQDRDAKLEAVLQETAATRRTVQATQQKTTTALRQTRGLLERQMTRIQAMGRCLDHNSKQTDKDVWVNEELQLKIRQSVSILEAHKRDTETCNVRTRALEKATAILEKHFVVAITGVSGVGKTHIAMCLMNSLLEKRSGLRPLVISASEIETLVDPSVFTIVLMDDVFGSQQVNHNSLSEFCRMSSFLQALVRNRQGYVILTMRTAIKQALSSSVSQFDDRKHSISNFLAPNVVLDLASESFRYTCNEKKELLELYAGMKNISLDEPEMSKIVELEPPIGFPLICSYIRPDNTREVFQKPIVFIQDQLNQLFQKGNVGYAVLALVLFSGGELQRVDQLWPFETKKLKIRPFLKFDTTESEFFEEANRLCHTFLSYDSQKQVYTFIHESVLEAVVISCGKTHPVVTLKEAPIRIIAKYCHPYKAQTEDQLDCFQTDEAHHIHPSQYSLVVERFCFAIEEQSEQLHGHVAEASVWSDPSFLAAVYKLDTETTVRNLFLKTDVQAQSLFAHFCKIGRYEVVSNVLDKLKKLSSFHTETCKQQIFKGCELACRFCHGDIVHFLLSFCEGKADKLLLYAAEGGDVEITDALVKVGGSLQTRDSNFCGMIHIACFCGNLDLIRYLVEHDKYCLTHRDSAGSNAAFYTSAGGHISVLDYLLDNDCDIKDTCRMFGCPVFHIACLAGHLDMVKHLRLKYPDMLQAVDTKRGFSSALYAAAGGSEDLLEYLQGEGVDLNHPGNEGETVIHLAAVAGQLKVLQYLVTKVPDMVKAIDGDGTTTICKAASTGDVDCFRFLLGAGADPRRRTSSQSKSILHVACFQGQLAMTKYLVSTYPDMLHGVDDSSCTPIFDAAAAGHIDVFEYLVAAGADPKERSGRRKTLLHVVCRSGNLEMCEYLLEKFPWMLTSVDDEGLTPLHSAAEEARTGILDHLISVGADPHCRTNRGFTILHMSANCGHVRMTAHIVDKFPDMLYTVDDCSWTPLMAAAVTGRIAITQYLISKGADPNCRSSDGQSLLHKACLNGQLGLVKYLIGRFPLMVGVTDNNRYTVTLVAAGGGHIGTLDYLVSQGADVNCRTDADETLLHIACRNGRLPMAKHLLQRFPEMARCVDNCQSSALLSAAVSDNTNLIEYLFGEGFDPNERNYLGKTPLHRASRSGCLEMMRFLIIQYPDMLEAVDNNNFTVLSDAAYGGKIDIVKHLIGIGCDHRSVTNIEHTLLHLACCQGRLEMAKYLTTNYPYMVDSRALDGSTAIFQAIATGHVDVVDHLMSSGADPLQKLPDGRTMLHIACLQGQLDMTRHLVSISPDFLDNCSNETTPILICASKGGNVDVFDFLVSIGCSPQSRNKKESTVLHVATRRGQVRMVDHLLAQYPDMVGTVDCGGLTALHCAAEKGHLDVLEHLILANSDPLSVTNDGETLMHLACEKGRLDMVKHLIERFPEMLKIVGHNGYTVLMTAVACGHLEIAEYLIGNVCDPFSRTRSGEVLLHIACLYGHMEMAVYLVTMYADSVNAVDAMLMIAVAGGNRDIVDLLVGTGADPYRKHEERSLLHIACYSGFFEMVRHLLEKYPDMLELTDTEGCTPLLDAVESGDVPKVELLISKGANPYHRTHSGQTSLHIACARGHFEIVKQLMSAYPDLLTISDNRRKTALMYAEDAGDIDVIQHIRNNCVKKRKIDN